MDEDAARPPRKRRAAQACKSCRTRKVRCDLVATGFPPGCTNCKLDGITCELMGNKRRRTIHLPQDHHAVERSTDAATSLANVPHESVISDAEDRFQATSIPEDPPQLHGDHNEHNEVEADGLHQDSALHHADRLPSYIHELPSTVSVEDLTFLSARAALTIPPPNFLRVILCRYIEFVHPSLPLLDMSRVAAIINDGQGDSDTISLVLLLAMVYAAMPFVELKHVRTIGFSSKLEARTAFYKKVKLLYDLGIDQDILTLTQVTLLMSTPHGSMDPVQDAWYWIGLAISHAHSIGLHLDIGKSDARDSKRRLRRRVWWCCYIREQVVAMGLGRPSRITYYNVPMLSISDFDFAPIPDMVAIVPAQCPGARDPATQQKLAIILIEKAKLCICIGRAVAVMCAIRDNNSRSSALILSKALHDATACAKELDSWATMLSVEATYDAKMHVTYKLKDRALIAAIASLHMLYYDAICLLNRPVALATNLPSPVHESTIATEESRRLIRWAAKELVGINSDLHQLGLLSYLDATSVANVVAAVVVNLLDVRSDVKHLRETAIGALQQCADFLHVFKVTYGSAIHAYRFLEATLKSDDFPTNRNGQFQEPHPRNKMQAIDQLSSIFSPEEVVASPSVNGIASTRTPMQQSFGQGLDTHAFTDEFAMDDMLRGDDHWLMPNFGTMDLPASFQF